MKTVPFVVLCNHGKYGLLFDSAVEAELARDTLIEAPRLRDVRHDQARDILRLQGLRDELLAELKDILAFNATVLLPERCEQIARLVAKMEGVK